MKRLTGRQLQIAEGRSELPPPTVAAYRDLWRQQGYRLPPIGTDSTTCQHRGPVLDIRTCELCPATKDHIEVSIHVCHLHQQCTLRNLLTDVQACSRCSDHSPLTTHHSPACSLSSPPTAPAPRPRSSSTASPARRAPPAG